jgi:hypothetical protein
MSDNEIIVGSVTIVVFGVGAQSIGLPPVDPAACSATRCFPW